LAIRRAELERAAGIADEIKVTAYDLTINMQIAAAIRKLKE
jgi:hypothetical protein